MNQKVSNLHPTTVELLASLRSQATDEKYLLPDDVEFFKDGPSNYESRIRILVERAIVRRAVTDLLAAGFSISVNNGGDDDEVLPTNDPAKIMGGIMQTDHDYLMIHRFNAPANVPREGWVMLIYGNDGWDVINDYTTANIEHHMMGASDLADQLGDLL